MSNENITRRPATADEIAARPARFASERVVTVEVNTDGRATLGKAHTIHLATVHSYLNADGEVVRQHAEYVGCGSQRYRNAGGKGQPTARGNRYAVDCAKCLAATE